MIGLRLESAGRSRRLGLAGQVYSVLSRDLVSFEVSIGAFILDVKLYGFLCSQCPFLQDEGV